MITMLRHQVTLPPGTPTDHDRRYNSGTERVSVANRRRHLCQDCCDPSPLMNRRMAGVGAPSWPWRPVQRSLGTPPLSRHLLEVEVSGPHTLRERVPFRFGETKDRALRGLGVAHKIRVVTPGYLYASTTTAELASPPVQKRLGLVHSDHILFLFHVKLFPLLRHTAPLRGRRDPRYYPVNLLPARTATA
jgi:hypothetical protein